MQTSKPDNYVQEFNTSNNLIVPRPSSVCIFNIYFRVNTEVWRSVPIFLVYVSIKYSGIY